MIRYNYHKHQVLFKLEKDFQKPTITEMHFWGKESIQINLTSAQNSEHVWRRPPSTIPPK